MEKIDTSLISSRFGFCDSREKVMVLTKAVRILISKVNELVEQNNDLKEQIELLTPPANGQR